MTLTAPTSTTVDAKGGYCARCRAGGHALCASPPGRCTCDQGEHPNRPAGRRLVTETTPDVVAQTSAAKPARAGKSSKVEPVWELVKAAPAAPPPAARKPTPAELAQPMLEAIVESDDRDSWRIALFGTPHAAGRAKALLAKEFPAEWEWTSGRDTDGRSAVFVRWLGGAE